MLLVVNIFRFRYLARCIHHAHCHLHALCHRFVCLEIDLLVVIPIAVSTFLKITSLDS